MNHVYPENVWKHVEIDLRTRKHDEAIMNCQNKIKECYTKIYKMLVYDREDVNDLEDIINFNILKIFLIKELRDGHT